MKIWSFIKEAIWEKRYFIIALGGGMSIFFLIQIIKPSENINISISGFISLVLAIFSFFILLSIIILLAQKFGFFGVIYETFWTFLWVCFLSGVIIYLHNHPFTTDTLLEGGAMALIVKLGLVTVSKYLGLLEGYIIYSAIFILSIFIFYYVIFRMKNLIFAGVVVEDQEESPNPKPMLPVTNSKRIVIFVITVLIYLPVFSYLVNI